MIFITKKQIEDLGITPLQCVEWVDEGFKMKYRSQMPAKTAIHLTDSLDFLAVRTHRVSLVPILLLKAI